MNTVYKFTQDVYKWLIILKDRRKKPNLFCLLFQTSLLNEPLQFENIVSPIYLDQIQNGIDNHRTMFGILNTFYDQIKVKFKSYDVVEREQKFRMICLDLLSDFVWSKNIKLCEFPPKWGSNGLSVAVSTLFVN